MESAKPEFAMASDLAPAADSARGGRLLQMTYTLGGIGLLGATAADAIAVAGRHTGMHLLGSIEIVQACVVMLGSAAMLIATLSGEHASVHIITERLSPATAARLARGASLVSGITFLFIAAGSAWLCAEMWGGYERTELLHLPLRWLRLGWVIFALLISAAFLRRALREA